MKLTLFNHGLRKPLSTRHMTTDLYTRKFKYDSDSLSPANPNPSTIAVACEIHMGLDIRHIPSFTRVNNPTPQPTAPSTLLSLSSWNNTMDTLKKGNQTAPRRSRLLAPSPYPPRLVSLVLNQVCHIRRFWFALRVFSITDLVFLSFRPVSFSHAFFGLHRSLLLLCLPLCFPKESRVISPQSFQKRRVLCHLSSKSSISIIFHIGYERLLIKYMLKEFSRFQFSRLLSNTSLLHCIVFYFASSLTPPLHR